MRISIRGAACELLPEHGILLDDGTLVVADVHLGKAIAFQAKGLAVPEGDSEADLTRLLNLCRTHRARRLVINGDLFHSPAGIPPEMEDLLRRWMETLAIPVQLVIGNHEMKFRKLPPDLEPVHTLDMAGFHLVHDPKDALAGVPSICAHWHPVAKIADGRRTSLRLPCFLLRGDVLVLPSFGKFTGGAVMRCQTGDRFFVAPGDRVTEVPAELVR